MIKTIWIQVLRIALVFAVLAALVTWQHHFVLSGLQANPYLNALIISVFGFGTLTALGALAGMRNDVRAFAALKSAYDDTQAERHNPRLDLRQRLSRCREPGLVYRAPELLGHVFELTFEELLRTRHMRISVATMQHLISAIENRMAHRRSLMGYLTGLCVFMGLIGTFIGLMEMVGSVGGIIGGLAQGDSASPESIKRLIHDLEAPLTGMATGFSCSLFGLFSSLMLGLFSRFVNTAGDSVKNEFETWLAGISQIETRQEAGRIEGSVTPAGVQADGGAAASVSRVGESMTAIADALRRVVERQDLHTDLLERTCRLLDRAAQQDSAALAAIAKTETLQDDVARLRDDMSRHAQGLRQVTLGAFEQVARLAREQHDDGLRELAHILAAQAEAHASLRQVQADLGTQAAAPLAAEAIAQAVNAGVGELASALDGSLRQVGAELARVAESQRATTAAVAQAGRDDIAGEIRDLGRSMQNGLKEGFGEMTETFDRAFQAYAGLLRHVLKNDGHHDEQQGRAQGAAQRSA